MTEIIINSAIFFAFFFALTSVVQKISQKTNIPYTVLLLVFGFIAQLLGLFFYHELHISLDPQIIYYILLPLLLFESSIHMNIHQFKLQFWTISFISTFGLLVSLLVVAFGLTWVLGLPLEVGLLFGALISATDPIAVLSLFKSLGAPKRLALIADGESMFNDATAVIAFKVVTSFVFASSYFNSDKLFSSFSSFIWMFFGSIFIGAILGYIFSQVIRKIKEDPIVEASVTLALALGSFIVADHFLGLSGVITTVIAGVVLGNLGRTYISRHSTRFINETWEYIAFICVSLVFFFASFQLDIKLIWENIEVLHAVIIIVLLARAISVYLSFYLSNKLPLFKNEPDVPLSWQHIMNWGGLRGVIPLVLAYSIPDSYQYKPEIISFTLATLVFTLLINGLTIKWLLIKLKLHLPKKEEEIISEEHLIYEIEKKIEILKTLPLNEFNEELTKAIALSLKQDENIHKQKLSEMSDEKELEEAIRLQALEIIRKKLLASFYQGYITEGVYQEYEAQLDLQQDALEYPEVVLGRGYSDGRLPNKKLFRQRIKSARNLIWKLPFIGTLFGNKEEEVVKERLMILKAKSLGAADVLNYIAKFKLRYQKSDKAFKVLSQIENDYQKRKSEYDNDISDLKKDYLEVYKNYQKVVLENIIH